MAITPSDVYYAVENPLSAIFLLASSWQHVAKVVRVTLPYKMLIDMLEEGVITPKDIHARLRIIANYDMDALSRHPADDAVYIYLTVLQDHNIPFSDKKHDAYLKGCEIASEMNNLQWSTRHVSYWKDWRTRENNMPMD